MEITTGGHILVPLDGAHDVKDSTLTGFILDSTEFVGQKDGVDQVVISPGTDGAITAGAGAVTIDSDGISITMDTSYTDVTSFKFDDGTTVYGGVQAYYDGASAVHLKYGIQTSALASKDVDVYLTATHGSAAFRSSVYIDSNAGDFAMTKAKTTGAITYKMTSMEHIIAELGDNAGADYFQVQAANDTAALTVYSDGKTVVHGNMLVGSATANANQTLGVTVNQGANDDVALALKSSDVGHAMTGNAEADTYGEMLKAQATSGGLNIRGYKDADGDAGYALQLLGRLGEAADTTKTTAGLGVVSVSAQITNGGTGVTAVGADGNLMVIRNSATTRFIFDAEGSAHGDVEWVAFDKHDDVALLGRLEDTLTAWADPVKAEFASFLESGRGTLEELGIVHFDDDNPGHAMVNFTRLSMLLVGAVRQQAARLDAYERGLLTA